MITIALEFIHGMQFRRSYFATHQVSFYRSSNIGCIQASTLMWKPSYTLDGEDEPTILKMKA